MFKQICFWTILLCFCKLTHQQQNVDDIIKGIFTTPSSNPAGTAGAIPNSNPVRTPARPGGFGIIVEPEPDNGDNQPLVTSTGKVCKCVPYYLCSPENNTLMSNNDEVDGFGILDVRIEICPEAVDVCCGGTREVYTSPPPVTPVKDRPNRASGCGVRNVDGIDVQLVGNLNNEAGFGEFPWTVALIQINDDKCVCGGSLIHPQVILTANHCVRKLNPRNLKIRAGEWDSQTIRERLPFQERTVKQIINHPQYEIKTLGNDIALVVVNTPFTLDDHINVICLPGQNIPSTSTDCYASGWGKDVFGLAGRRSVIMKRVKLPIVPIDQCERSLRETRLGSTFTLHESFLCAGGQRGIDTCEGDGGAPLVCPTGNPSENRYTQSGIVAWGIGCNEARPAVYANVGLFRDWIDTNMRNLNFDISSYSNY